MKGGALIAHFQEEIKYCCAGLCKIRKGIGGPKVRNDPAVRGLQEEYGQGQGHS